MKVIKGKLTITPDAVEIQTKDKGNVNLRLLESGKSCILIIK